MHTLGEIQAVWQNRVADVKLIETGTYLRVSLPLDGTIYLPGDIYMIDPDQQRIIKSNL